MTIEKHCKPIENNQEQRAIRLTTNLLLPIFSSFLFFLWFLHIFATQHNFCAFALTHTRCEYEKKLLHIIQSHQQTNTHSNAKEKALILKFNGNLLVSIIYILLHFFVQFTPCVDFLFREE